MLTYHLIICVKYRRKAIDDRIAARIREIGEYVGNNRLIKKEFPQVRKMLWKEMFWSPSYCLLTTGGAPLETLKKYIESQGRE